MTLTKALFPAQSALQKLLLVLGGTLFIALAAQVSVPMFPVPMTLQTLAILIVGLTFGARLGAATLLAYLAQGAAGLPVFAGGQATLAYMMGPTGGFLIGFVAMAWLAGAAVERGLARGIAGTAAVALAATALLYLPGVAWLTAITPLTLGGAVEAGMLPFLAGDAVKAVLAALVVTGGWTALKRRG
jgi:biotin transport system substrate-specific component